MRALKWWWLGVRPPTTPPPCSTATGIASNGFTLTRPIWPCRAMWVYGRRRVNLSPSATTTQWPIRHGCHRWPLVQQSPRGRRRGSGDGRHRGHRGGAGQCHQCVGRNEAAHQHHVAPSSLDSTWMLYPMGTNVVFRRRALVEIGGFDETFEYHHDETDVCRRLMDLGLEVGSRQGSGAPWCPS